MKDQPTDPPTLMETTLGGFLQDIGKFLLCASGATRRRARLITAPHIGLAP